MRLFRSLLVVAGLLTVDLAAAKAPNILLILADDMGFSDLGCYGSEIRTPVLDGLAAGGLRFTQFYNTSRCCPTRASLLTGMYSHRVGFGHMTGRLGDHPAYTGDLSREHRTVAELLGEAGYRSYLSGKWHVTRNRKEGSANWPLQRGFDRFYGTLGGGHFFRPFFLAEGNRRIQPPDDRYHVTDAFTDKALEFLEEHFASHAERPFFLHLCYTAPHFPLHAWPEDIARYEGRYRGGWDRLRRQRLSRMKELGIIGPDTRLSERDAMATAWDEAEDQTEWDLRMAVYAAMIEQMDRGIGKVLAELREQGALEDTVVMFLSDNGSSAELIDRGHQPGARTGTADSYKCLEVGWSNAANSPFRMHKMWVHEGGIATPLIVSWPGRIKAPGSLVATVGHVIDLLPTCLEMAGIETAAGFDGRSLVPVLRGQVRRRDGPWFWEHEGSRAVRSGDWKLVSADGGAWELYDLNRDRSETRNLAAMEPGRVAALAARWGEWAREVGVVDWAVASAGRRKGPPGYRRR